MEYMRIGTTYYRIVRKPTSSGDSITSLITWSTECIRQDHGKSFLSSIPKESGILTVMAVKKGYNNCLDTVKLVRDTLDVISGKWKLPIIVS